MNKVARSKAGPNIVLALVCIAVGWIFCGAGSLGSAQTPPAGLSPGLREFIKLVQAQMNDDIILAYIKNSGFTLTANDIVYLTKEGIPPEVISELLKTSPPPTQPEPNPPPSAVPVSNLPPALQNIIRLAKAGVSDDIILAYIKNPGSTYTLTADDILYLKDQGLSENVITALLQTKSPGTLAPTASTPSPSPASLPEASSAETVASTPAPAPSTVPPEAESESPTTAQAPAPAAEPVVNADYVQQQLSPYGAWVNVPEYGQCWQPSSIPLGWRPYYDSGHWVYTDAGLYWQSDYPWGAIPFHYGRWAYVGGYGWIWVPGYEYAPAWVVWRHTDGYVGWAPLPYGAVWVSGGWWQYRGVRVAADYDFGLGVSFFAFVDYHHLWEHDYHPYVLHHDELHRVYRQSVINRFGRDEHGRFVNEGLDRQHLERFTGRKVDVVRHEELQKHERVVLQSDHARAVERLRSQSVAPRPREAKLQQRARTATGFDGLAAERGSTGGVNPPYRLNATAMKPQGTREQADNAQAGQKGSESALAMRKFLNAMKQSVPIKPEQNGDHNKPSENKDQQRPGGNQ